MSSTVKLGIFSYESRSSGTRGTVPMKEILLYTWVGTLAAAAPAALYAYVGTLVAAAANAAAAAAADDDDEDDDDDDDDDKRLSSVSSWGNGAGDEGADDVDVDGDGGTSDIGSSS
jgi:hypothetical protein